MKLKVEFRENDQRIQVGFGENSQQIQVGMAESETSIPVRFDNVYESSALEHYDGSYLITPKVYDQSIDTSDKRMDGDLVVQKIPYMPVSNSAGGLTVTIGGE